MFYSILFLSALIYSIPFRSTLLLVYYSSNLTLLHYSTSTLSPFCLCSTSALPLHLDSIFSTCTVPLYLYSTFTLPLYPFSTPPLPQLCTSTLAYLYSPPLVFNQGLTGHNDHHILLTAEQVIFFLEAGADCTQESLVSKNVHLPTQVISSPKLIESTR